jgi:hypothetical protein
MSENVFPIEPGGLRTGAGMVPASSDATYGTHYSYLGVGGYVEVPNMDFRNDIPVSSTIGADGYSSGRRRLGMMVYVIGERKLFQLNPKRANGTLVTIEEWDSASDAQKLVWLDPTTSAFDFSTFSQLTGTGNHDDAWEQLDFSGGGSGSSVTGTTLTGSVLTIKQSNGEPNVSVDLSGIDDRFVYGGSYNSGVLTLNISGADDVEIPLQGLVNTIVDSAAFDNQTNQITFSSAGGGDIFSVDLSSLKDNEDNLVSDSPEEGEVDVVTEDELTHRINTDFQNYLDDNLNGLV